MIIAIIHAFACIYQASGVYRWGVSNKFTLISSLFLNILTDPNFPRFPNILIFSPSSLVCFQVVICWGNHMELLIYFEISGRLLIFIEEWVKQVHFNFQHFILTKHRMLVWTWWPLWISSSRVFYPFSFLRQILVCLHRRIQDVCTIRDVWVSYSKVHFLTKMTFVFYIWCWFWQEICFYFLASSYITMFIVSRICLWL